MSKAIRIHATGGPDVLRWEDVDLAKNMITVKSREEFLTKSRKSRTIPLSQRMRELLKKIPRRSEKLFDLNNLERPKAKKNNLCNIMKRLKIFSACDCLLRKKDIFLTINLIPFI